MRKIEKIILFIILQLIGKFNPKWGTNVQFLFYKRWGMNFNGTPNYISSKVWFDGTDYKLIYIGDQVTISSYVRILSHDWSLHTVAKAFGIYQEKPLGKILPVSIGDFSFIGTGVILMPGCKIGKACIIGSGSVVRGEVPDFSVYIGSPGKIIGDVRDYVSKKLDIDRESLISSPPITS